MNVRELRKLASKLNIKGYSRMRKAELEIAIAKAQNEPIDMNQSRFTESDVQEIGKGSLANAAIYLTCLTAANGGKKGPARKFRKLLRKAGYKAHASVDVRRIDEYKREARQAAAA